jgi:hypothetical protein
MKGRARRDRAPARRARRMTRPERRLSLPSVMSVTPFPKRTSLRRLEIDEPTDIAALERAVSGVAGVAAATGGAVALAGRNLFELSVAERARLLTAMYDAGEVVFGWRDGRDGSVVNVVVERLAAGAEAVVWRAEVYVEDDGGHVLKGALAARRVDVLASRLVGAASEGFPEPMASSAGAVAAALRE